jgi:arsenate reductase
MNDTAHSPYNVLFLCTGNSARSILAEAILNRISGDKFRAYSAGSHPKGQVHPQAMTLLGGMGHDLSGLRSKSWDEFVEPGAPPLDFLITVCDDAAGEVCPVWPGHPMTAHWGMPDPASVGRPPAALALAFAETYRILNNRIGLFASLPITGLDRLSLRRRMDEIGLSQDGPGPV